MTPSLSAAVSGDSSLPHGFDVHALAMSLQVALATLEPLIHQASAPFHAPPGGRPAPARAKASSPSPASPASADAKAPQTRGCHIPLASFAGEIQYLQRNDIKDTHELMAHLLDRLDMTVLLIEQIDVTQDMPDGFMWRLGQFLREPLELLRDIHDVMQETEQELA